MIPRRRRGETPIEILCSTCLRETYHLQRRGRWYCLTCGRANDPSQLALFRPTGEERHARLLDTGGNRGGSQTLGANTASTSASHWSTTASRPSDTTALGHLQAAELEAHDRDPGLARFIYSRAGLRLENNIVQTWRVADQRLQVVVWPDESRRYVLRIKSGWPAAIKRHRSQQPPTGLALAEVYASTTTNELHLPRGPELARWKRRALVDAGIISPHPVHLALLPPTAPSNAQETWDAIRGLLQIRFLVDPEDEPVPLSSPFLASWSGLPQSRIERGKHWLEQHGLITRAGNALFGWPAPCLLWRVTTAERAETTPQPDRASNA